MPEYIEREEVMKTARDGYHSDFGRSMADLTSLRELLEDTSVADVVEVVRCKDCIHYEEVGSRHFCNEYGGHVTDNDYCSRAEKKGR